MRFCYADPPYIGQAKRYVENQEVDHKVLVERLCSEFPDGWALSSHTPGLQLILALCPSDVRVAAWVKPFCIFKPNVNPAYAWEPVIWRGGRRRTREQKTLRDWVSANITLRKGLSGVKPKEFCFWLFALLNMQPGDEFVDLFPGSGAVTQAWEVYQQKESILQEEIY